MRERKYIKFRVDMYDGTKFKIIDMKPERDLVHYVWTRVVTLAGKVNLEGDLYLSKNIPYTIETLAIEFNRDTDQIKLALNVLIELEMIGLTEENIYRVKNFAKHQNIKIKEKINYKDKEDKINNKKVQVKENIENEIHDNEDKESENKISQNATDDDIGNLEITHKDINKIYDSLSGEKINNNSQDNIPILLEVKKSKKSNKINCLDFKEEIKDNVAFHFRDGDEKILLSEGENVIEA